MIKAVRVSAPVTLLTGSILALFGFWWKTVLHLSNLLWTVDSYSHGLLVPFISLYLVWDRRHSLPMSTVNIEPWGLFMLFSAAMLWRVGSAAEIMLFTHIALITAVNGLIMTFMGWTFYKAILFPVLFLFLMVPFGESFIPVLQVITAKLSISGLNLLGVANEVDGVIITLSSGVFEVARACAGIKFLFTSLVTGVLLAHLAYRTWKKRLLLVAFAISLPVLANALRVTTILLLAEYYDSDFAKGVDHLVYGWGFLSFILIVLIAVAYRFAEEGAGAETTSGVHPEVTSAIGARQAIIILTAFTLPILATFHTYAENLGNRSVMPPSTFDCEECDIRPLGSPVNEIPYFKGSDGYFAHRYRQNDHILTVRGALYCDQRVGHRILQPQNKWAPDGWKLITGSAGEKVEFAGWELERQSYYRGKARIDVYVAYTIDLKSKTSPLSVKLQTAFSRFSAGHSTGSVLTFTGMPSTDMASRERDRKKIESFLSTFSKERFLWTVNPIANNNGQDLCAA